MFVLGIALVAALGLLGRACWQNYWWQQTVNFVADEAGAAGALVYFHKGQRVLWEIHETNDHPRFSGRYDGSFEIWMDEYSSGMPEPWQYAQRRKVAAHNRQLRYLYDHPEKFQPGTRSQPNNTLKAE